MHKIPVTVISGFLGAGKTTLVRHLLQNNRGRRIAVIVNEFGEVGIDGELLRSCQVCDEAETSGSKIIELTNGCLCCTVQEEFYPTMQELLKRREEIDCLLIETSGLALPKPLVKAFNWPTIRNSATVDGVITVVDCQALAHGAFAEDLEALEAQRKADPNLEHETPLEELFEDQLACADLVLLTKSDSIDSADVDRIKIWLKQKLSPRVKVVVATKGQIAPDLLLGFNAAVEDNLDTRPSHHDDEVDHEHDDNIDSVEIVCDRAFEPEVLISKLQKLLQQYEIYRIKGFVNVAAKPMRLVLQGVGNRCDRFYDRFWQRNEVRQTRLVLIGRNLERELVEAVIFE